MNPKWYTPYTPYQAEISQGRLESLYNFQTMIQDITKLPLSNASLLDIGSTSAEVLSISNSYHKNNRKKYIVSDKMFPYLIDILKLKSSVNNIDLDICNLDEANIDENTIGIMFQYPDTYGEIKIPYDQIKEANKNNSIVSCATDLMALTRYKPPGEIGVDISFGSAQRFGIPLYNGGPHPAFISTKDNFVRLMPGRIVGKSIDTFGDSCYRLSLQSREQHIKKDKATSNICTSQALLANITAMYGLYHGNEGILNIGQDIYRKTTKLKNTLDDFNIKYINNQYFDTLTIVDKRCKSIYKKLEEKGYISSFDIKNPDKLSISLDETINMNDLTNIRAGLSFLKKESFKLSLNKKENKNDLRNSEYLKNDIFKKYNDENNLTRYISNLSTKDYTLTEGMIPLGSCTMKLNSSFQLEPLLWDNIMNVHPYLPNKYKEGYNELINKVGDQLKDITGFNNVSFHCNSGAMGEYTALLCIKIF